MQVFSKLQRNSSYKTFIKIILIFFVNSLSSFFFFFPILMGYFLFCDDIFFSLFYIGFFSILHNVNVFYLLIFYLILRLFLYKKIIEYINYEYQSVVYVLLLYFVLFLYFINQINLENLIFFFLFNFSFDILLIKVSKCEVKSL
jgi:hypothetical protein